MQEGGADFLPTLLAGFGALLSFRWTAQSLRVPCIPTVRIPIRNFTLDVHFPPLPCTSPWLIVHFEAAQVHPGQLLLLEMGSGITESQQDGLEGTLKIPLFLCGQGLLPAEGSTNFWV